MTKDFKTKMKENQRRHEEEKQRLQKDMEQDRRNFKEQRKHIEKEVSEESLQSLSLAYVMNSFSDPETDAAVT